MPWLPGIVRYFDEKTTGPGVTDDINDGFEVSDFWIDETANKAYVCLDNAVGAAVWQELGAGGGGGESDHGELDGLADDDHSQYHTDDRGDARYSVLAHDHDLVYAALAHDHDDRYYTETEADLAFAVIAHDHDEDYAAIGHDHDLVYAIIAHAHDETYAALAHNHDSDYAADDHAHNSDYISIIAEPTAGNLAEVTAEGELVDSGYDPTDFAGASHNHDSDYISVVGTPTEGNLPELTSGGELADSGYAPDDFAVADHDHDPLGECAVLASMSANSDNFAVDTEITVPLDTEIFDLGGDFNAATYIFTAPVSGKYEINFRLRLINVDSAATYYATKIVTSNRSYITYLYASRFSGDVTAWTLTGSVLADMDENDTCYLTIAQSGGTQQTDISYTSYATTLSIHGKDTALFGTGVTNGNSHDHAGGDGAQIDHGGLGGLSDDDHSQYSLVDGTRTFTGGITAPGATIAASAAHTQLKIVSDTDKRANVKLLDTDNDGWSFRKNTAANNKQFEIAYTTDDSSYTDYLSISAAGEMNLPLQPAFQAAPSSEQSNIAVNSDVTVVFDSEVFDQASDFASNTFTAPVTGKYSLFVHIRLTNVDSASDYYYIQLITSNRTYMDILYTNRFSGDPGGMCLQINVLADMDADDTAYVIIKQAAGTQQTDIPASSLQTQFSGFLAC